MALEIAGSNPLQRYILFYFQKPYFTSKNTRQKENPNFFYLDFEIRVLNIENLANTEELESTKLEL